jgi:hypothetical protein
MEQHAQGTQTTIGQFSFGELACSFAFRGWLSSTKTNLSSTSVRVAHSLSLAFVLCVMALFFACIFLSFPG